MRPAAASPVVHLELHTADQTAASAVLAELCGWRPQRIDTPAGSYLSLCMGRGFGGGIVEGAARRPLWLPYVQVGDVERATEHARALGAAVLLEPRAGPAGRRSVVATAAGGELAFWQPHAPPDTENRCMGRPRSG
jgi:predicted enzyme related to lactoylglutathione lyase